MALIQKKVKLTDKNRIIRHPHICNCSRYEHHHSISLTNLECQVSASICCIDPVANIAKELNRYGIIPGKIVIKKNSLMDIENTSVMVDGKTIVLERRLSDAIRVKIDIDKVDNTIDNY